MSEEEVEVWKCPVCKKKIGDFEDKLVFVFPDSYMAKGDAFFDLSKEQRYHEACFNDLPKKN